MMFAVGDLVRLTVEPSGYMSKYAPVTVGNIYEVKGYMGSCLVTTSDEPNETVSLHHESFEAV
jgi:hypothetical protein